MLKRADHFPESLTYLPNLPAHLRQRVFAYLDGPLPEGTTPGMILIRPLFEKILAQILAKDYGTGSAYPLNPMKVSSLCTATVYLIQMCEYLFN